MAPLKTYRIGEIYYNGKTNKMTTWETKTLQRCGVFFLYICVKDIK